MYKSVLVATDGSETAGEAVRVAVELAKTFGATLHIVSVYQSGSKGSPPRHGAERRLPGLGRHAQHRGHVARRHRFQRPGARDRDEDPRHLGYCRRPDRVDRRRPAGGADRRRQQGHEGPEADPRQRPERRRALSAVRCAHRQDDLRLASGRRGEPAGKNRPLPLPSSARQPASSPERLGPGLGEALRVARRPRVGDHERRARRQPGTPRRVRRPGARPSLTPPRWWR